MKFMLIALIGIFMTQLSFARPSCGPNQAPPCMNGDWLQCPGSVYYSDLRDDCPLSRPGKPGKGQVVRPEGIRLKRVLNGVVSQPSVGGPAEKQLCRLKTGRCVEVGNGMCSGTVMTDNICHDL